jgi:hypothetical protein
MKHVHAKGINRRIKRLRHEKHLGFKKEEPPPGFAVNGAADPTDSLRSIRTVAGEGAISGYVSHGAPGIDQYWSELSTSPPFRVPSAHHALRLTESFMNRTDPSAKASQTPPGWLLLGGQLPRGPT